MVLKIRKSLEGTHMIWDGKSFLFHVEVHSLLGLCQSRNLCGKEVADRATSEFN